MARFKRIDPVMLGILLLAGILLLTGLESTSTWRDEAEVLNVGRNVLTAGVPTAWDGKQYVTQPADRDDHDLLWLHSWLEFYAVAAAMKLFGMALGNVRLLFALIGMLSVLLTYTLGMALFQRRPAARIAAFLLTTNVVFLLHARQARYYVLAVFFVLAVIHAYGRVLHGKRWGKPLFVASAVGLFHSNWFSFFVIAACICLDLARRTVRAEDGKLKIQRAPWRSFVALAIPTAAFTAPLFVFLHPYTRTGSFLATAKSFALETAQYHGLTLSVFVFPLALLAAVEFIRIKGLPRQASLAIAIGAGLLIQLAFLRGMPSLFATLTLLAAAAIVLAGSGRLYRANREAEGFLWQTIAAAIVLATLLASQFRDIRYVLYVTPLAFLLVGRLVDRLFMERAGLPVAAAGMTVLLAVSTAAPAIAFLPFMPLAGLDVNPAGIGARTVREAVSFHSPLAAFWAETRAKRTDGPEAACLALARRGAPGQTVLTTRDVWMLPFQFHCPQFVTDQEDFARPVLFGYEPVGEPDWIVRALRDIPPEHFENYTRVELADHERVFTVFEESNRPEPWLHAFTGPNQATFELYRHERLD